MGAPGANPKLTDEKAEAICRLLRGGAFMKTAAESVGVDESTVHRWLRKGQAPDPRPLPASASKAEVAAREQYVARLARYRSFYQSTREAIAFSEHLLISRLQEASRGQQITETITETKPDGTVTQRVIVREGKVDVAATTFLVERRFHDRWGKKETLTHQGPDGEALLALGPLVTSDPEAAAAARALRDRIAAANVSEEADDEDIKDLPA